MPFLGRVVGHPAGFAFVNPLPGSPDAPPHPTLKVDLALLHGAFHGDTVMARVVGKTDKGFSGEVVKVVEHAVKRVVGRYEVSRGHAHVVPFDRRLFQNVQAQSASEAMKVESGDMVVLKITRTATATRAAAGEVTERLGRMDDPGVDLKVILAQYEFTAEFPADVVKETEAAAANVSDEEIKRRMDFRPWTTITIDPETAKDHDDAISIARHSNGNYVLAVHIADVAHYVREGSALDACAYARGNSVYFPGFVVPMLPHALSSRICSLVEGQNRLTQTAVLEVDLRGQVVKADFHDGVIRSAGKLAYKDAQAILDGDPAARARFPQAVETVELSAELALVLNQARKDRGSLDFDLPEPELQLDPLGVVENITSNPRLFAMRMIEEFMLIANEAVAKALSEKNVATLYRIHESPDPDRLEEYLELVRTFGYTVTADLEHPQGKDFQRILRQVEGRPEERLLTYLMLRTQRLARYSPENLGHFGLASENYLHFTSPIRRYPDLVAHRALRALRHGKDPAAGDLASRGDGVAPRRDRAQGRGCRARPHRLEEGALHVGPGGGDVPRRHFERDALRSVRAARRYLRRGPRPHHHHGRRLLHLSRHRSRPSGRADETHVQARRPRRGSARQSGHGSPPGQPRPDRCPEANGEAGSRTQGLGGEAHAADAGGARTAAGAEVRSIPVDASAIVTAPVPERARAELVEASKRPSDGFDGARRVVKLRPRGLSSPHLRRAQLRPPMIGAGHAAPR